MTFTDSLIERTIKLKEDCNALRFSFDGYIYNPLDYAWNLHKQYLERYVKENSQVMFLGMNPGPFGMMQSGVPFGEINAVKEYLKISGEISKPENEHPYRPVLGLDCPRSEVSGRRIWGLVSKHYPKAEDFAVNNSIFNYCPLGFLENTKTAKNFTPDHLVKEERLALEKVCDSYLFDVIELVKPKYLIGVGKYAEGKLIKVNNDPSRVVSSIIHPSPGNPQANNGWEEKTIDKMRSLGLWK